MERVLELALEIADSTARSDIECFANIVRITDGVSEYDLSQPQADDGNDDDVALAQVAAEYINLRGDALPYTLVRGDGVVWFEDKTMEKDAVRHCRVCNCTDDQACPGGCSWVGPDLCSACEE